MHALARYLVALLIAIAAVPALAAEISGADRDAIRSIVTGQLNALQKDDGDAAYAYASPAIRELFPSPDIFMNMVRKGYPPVYRPKSVTFGGVLDTPSGPQQRVFLTGSDGKGYVALYTLQRQPDGSWKINGCTIVEDDGASI